MGTMVVGTCGAAQICTSGCFFPFLYSHCHGMFVFGRVLAALIKLKPQDRFWWIKFFLILDLQKVQEIIRKHHQTFMQLFWMTYMVMQYCAVTRSGILSLCKKKYTCTYMYMYMYAYITYGRVFGGDFRSPNNFMFWSFPENGAYRSEPLTGH